ncbi:hypothetical protein Anapl_17689 [Anas platyrhynchos]|uniref:Uncharacterized protein n=1 Tax=Anas platyrhynchos TaxID=8839 RepID=R0J8L3_ANAPL|nr:hypothetical protein Anapl_17689 [Anas platyrhynchos]
MASHPLMPQKNCEGKRQKKEEEERHPSAAKAEGGRGKALQQVHARVPPQHRPLARCGCQLTPLPRRQLGLDGAGGSPNGRLRRECCPGGRPAPRAALGIIGKGCTRRSSAHFPLGHVPYASLRIACRQVVSRTKRTFSATTGYDPFLREIQLIGKGNEEKAV